MGSIDLNPESPVPEKVTEGSIGEISISRNQRTDYDAQGDQVVIPDNDMVIYTGVSLRQSDIRKVTIPESVMKVGRGAFFGCTALEEVILLGNPTICEEAFSECTSLKSFVYPAKRGYTSFPEPIRICYPQRKDVNDEKFRNMCNRTPDRGFSGCTSLERVHLPEELYTISRETFLNCKALKKIEIPRTVRIIEEHAFSGCTSLESVVLPAGLDVICYNAFSGCTSLKSITIQGAGKEIPTYVFAGTAVEEVTIPEGVEKLHSTAFSGCPFLRKIIILGKNTRIEDEYRWEGSFRRGYKQLPSETGFSNKETLCIAAPRGSLAEEYANHYGIKFSAI